MPPRKKLPSKQASATSEDLAGRIVKRPDGYYWERPRGELRGPFQTRAEAEADRLTGGATEGEFEPGESLQEAESELGISEWIDPDTGGPAEDHIPRLEDH
jgi:hypothetical protein